VVLDLMLPGVDGLEVFKRLRAQADTKHIPVLMLTAKADEVDRIVGFELGADDYVTKPFSVRELMLRIKAVLRRARGGEEEKRRILTGGPIQLDTDGHVVRIDGQPVTLTATEFGLLEELMSRKGRVLSRELLLTNVWGYTHSGSLRTVDTHVRRLRAKLGDAAAYIETIRSVGYRFREALPAEGELDDEDDEA
jgi:two-component system phosphate regulon response regulator PhoB